MNRCCRPDYLGGFLMLCLVAWVLQHWIIALVIFLICVALAMAIGA